MTKMDMIWVATADLIHPTTDQARTVSRTDIEQRVSELFRGIPITPVMIEKHLVSWEDRQADRRNPRRGGSRNRYLFRTLDGSRPSGSGRFRLYKDGDSGHDGNDKTGKICPEATAIDPEYQHLLAWYRDSYFPSGSSYV